MKIVIPLVLLTSAFAAFPASAECVDGVAATVCAEVSAGFVTAIRVSADAATGDGAEAGAHVARGFFGDVSAGAVAGGDSTTAGHSAEAAVGSGAGFPPNVVRRVGASVSTTDHSTSTTETRGAQVSDQDGDGIPTDVELMP